MTVIRPSKNAHKWVTLPRKWLAPLSLFLHVAIPLSLFTPSLSAQFPWEEGGSYENNEKGSNYESTETTENAEENPYLTDFSQYADLYSDSPAEEDPLHLSTLPSPYPPLTHPTQLIQRAPTAQ